MLPLYFQKSFIIILSLRLETCLKFHYAHSKLSPQQQGKLTTLLLKGKSFVGESVLHHGLKKTYNVGTCPGFRQDDFTHLG